MEALDDGAELWFANKQMEQKQVSLSVSSLPPSLSPSLPPSISLSFFLTSPSPPSSLTASPPSFLPPFS